MSKYAKTDESGQLAEPVCEHLKKVGMLAKEYGSHHTESACLTGLFHDFGKYGESFQDVLRGTKKHIDHALPGAAFFIKITRKNSVLAPIAECINGHHGNMESFEKIKPRCAELTKHEKREETIVSSPNGRQSSLVGLKEFFEAGREFSQEVPWQNIVSLTQVLEELKWPKNKFEEMFESRMLLSALTDADYTVSAGEEQETWNTLNLDDAQARFDRYMTGLKSEAPESKVNDLRNQVSEQCMRAGEKKGRCYTVTAPTGVGKTLALMRFALTKCRTEGYKRIIVVLPFLSISDQTEDVYREIIPDLIVDNSLQEYSEEQRLLAAKWNAPCIITTSVKFFESLFSDRGPACRKLHNMADSVIIFDEAQSLPPELTGCAVNALNLLTKQFGSCVVLSTATQPDFNAINSVSWHPDEVIEDPQKLFQALRRVRVEWRNQTPVSLEDIAKEADRQNQVCVITNLRKHAEKIKETWGDEEGYFLITSAMCPAERRDIIATVKKRLKSGLPCKVSATQCIEIGVNLDFPFVYRAMAPLPSLVQAAGRCNRNGALKEGTVIIFLPDEKALYPDDTYRNLTVCTNEVCIKHNGCPDINDPGIIREYYQTIYQSHKDKKALLKAIDSKDYQRVRQEFQMIEKTGYTMIVPYGLQGTALCHQIKSELKRFGCVRKKMLKAAQPFMVTVYEKPNDAIDCLVRVKNKFIPSGCFLSD